MLRSISSDCVDNRSSVRDLGFEGHAERNPPRGVSLHEGQQVAERRGIVAKPMGQLTEHELTVPAAACCLSQARPKPLKASGILAVRRKRESLLRSVERLGPRAPQGGSGKYWGGLPWPTAQVEDAPESPEVERSARRRTDASRDPQLLNGGRQVAKRQMCPRNILTCDVLKHVERCTFPRHIKGSVEPPAFHVRQEELAQQHRPSCGVDSGLGKPKLRIFGPSGGSLGLHCFSKHRLGARGGRGGLPHATHLERQASRTCTYVQISAENTLCLAARRPKGQILRRREDPDVPSPVASDRCTMFRLAHGLRTTGDGAGMRGDR